jgi:outer membrane protein assembly factor BamE (lipoprotein component of BamABCDE complex)
MRKAVTMAFLILAVLACTAAMAAENLTPDKVKETLPGKTKQEVKELLGSPMGVSQFENDESGQWTYGSGGNYGGRAPVMLKKGIIIYDEITEKAVTSVTIQFKNGTVQRVQLAY